MCVTRVGAGDQVDVRSAIRQGCQQLLDKLGGSVEELNLPVPRRRQS